MDKLEGTGAYPIQWKRVGWIMAAVWTVIVAISLGWNVHLSRQEILSMARTEARALHQKDVVYREWNAKHGGVYVPVSEIATPNPYLKASEREITTSSGTRLTKINPAYMTRQVHELGHEEYGSIGHITSIDPIRPENAPDAWEIQALKAFEQGMEEVSSIEEIEGKAYMRLMRPLITTKECLQCHAVQGYREGDIRGGISISIPMAPLWAIKKSHTRGVYIGHALFLMIGLSGIGLGAQRLAYQTAEHEQASAEILRINQFQQHILDTAATAMFTVDADKTITSVNREFCRLTGFSEKEAVGQHCNILSGESCMMECGLCVLESKEPIFRRQCMIVTKDGRRLTILKNATLIRDTSGEVTGGIASFVDVTELVKAREEAEEASKKSELATVQAEMANAAKSNFLANMSHEIRTPMNTILGFLELVLEDPSLPEHQRKHLTIAQISASGLLRLIDDILDISKMESGKLTIEHRPFSILRLMQEIHATMNMKAREKGLGLQLDIHPSLSGAFIGDPLRLRQIIINLVGNALKFTERGSVSMRLLPAEEEGQLHFMVEDTGIGISTDELSRIFEPFTQADTSTTRRFGGTGLGTTIARELVELMGGRIWAESEVGKGSTFHFTVNMTPTDLVPEEADLFVVPGRAVSPSSRRGFKVLLAEDMATNVALAKIRLEQQGHKVTVARNGREAVEAFLREKIDVVLMDVQMPEMDGLEATARIRALEAGTGGHMPVIAITASIMKGEKDKCFEAGMDAVVAKPIDFSKLFRTMEDVVPEGVGEMVVQIQPDTGPQSVLELPPLDGVDIEKGIQHWQNPEAYAKALLVFSCDYGNAAADLSRFFDEGDTDGAYRYVHALKGVAGNLWITEVANVVIHISDAIKKKRIGDAKDRLPALAAALNSAVASIGQLKAEQDVQEMPKKEMDVPRLKELFAEMLAAFDQFSPYAIQPFLSELEKYLLQDQLYPIVKHVERFDFDEAKRETVNLTSSLNIDLEG